MEDLLRPRLVASRLLRWWRERFPNETSVATPLDALVVELGLDVATFAPELYPGTLGFLEPGEDLIFLREGLAEPVRRFTLAHELGHAVLHRNSGIAAAHARTLTGSANPASELDSCDTQDMEAALDLGSLGDETLRPGQAYSARAGRESEANAFAAALLLPAETLRVVYGVDHAASPNGEARPAVSARALAERFAVSEDVALRRLSALLAPGYEQLELLAQFPAESALTEPRGTLDADQGAAAASVGPALVVAGPGTGKTSTLVGRVAHLVRDEGITPDAILALTFSNKAAREMRERIARLLASSAAAADESEVESVPAPVTLPQIGTIHAFCGELLRQYAPRVGLRPDFRLVTQTEGYFLLRRITSELELSYYQPLAAPAMYFPDLLAAISRAKDELIDPPRYTALADAMASTARTHEQELAAARAVEVARVYTAYQRTLTARGDPDFGDVVRLAVQLLQEHPDVLAELRARYAQILVDEFQDINRAMGVLLHTLAGPEGPIWAVGDPDQAIYRFRGASPANIARFDAEYPGARIRRLGRNYRSYRPILEAAHAVAEAFVTNGAGATRPQTRPQLHATRGTPRSKAAARAVTLANAPDEAAELAGLAAAIRERQVAGRALLDQAVLCRTRRGAQRVVAALHAAGISTRVVAPLLEQDDVKDLLAVIALLAESSGAGLLRAGSLEDHAYAPEEARVLLDAAHQGHTSPLSLLSPASLAALEGLSPEGRAGFSRLAEVLAGMRSAPDVATGLSRYAFSLTGLGQRLLAGVAVGDPLLCERASHLARVLALAHAFEDHLRAAELDLGEEPDDEADAEQEGTAERARRRNRRVGAAWAEFLEYVRVLTVLRQEVGGADDAAASVDDGIWVLTVHASKGLEFPVVYLPGLAERRFPVQRQHVATPPPDGLVAQDGTPAHDRDEAHLAEEACLFYVALTRARDELILSVADRYGRVRAKPSRFLAPIEARLGAKLARSRWPARQPEQTSERATGADGITRQISPVGPVEGQPAGEAREPVSIAELETYQRCPRQYAYAYVYGLRSQGGALAALGRSVHETLRGLRDELRPTLEADAAPELTPELTLDEVQARFEREWEAARGGPAEVSGPYETVYRRYGRLMVERAWHSLMRQRARGKVAAEQNGHARVDAATGDAPQESEGQEGQGEARDGAQEVERQMMVRVGGREVSLTVDRVERAAPTTPAMAKGAQGGRAQVNGKSAPVIPLRLVRHRLTRGAERPDLRALLYTLAAEEHARRGETVELVQEHLPTGRSEQIELSARQRASLREELDDLMDGIESHSYPARQDSHICQGCPYLLICPA